MPWVLRQSTRPWVFLAAAVLAGCASTATPLVPQGHGENLELILTAYQAAVEGLQRPPKSVDELRPFLQKLGNPEQILTSPHDGEPYVILWGVDPRRLASSDAADPQPQLIAHERTGAGGIRYAATALRVTRLSEEEFQKARQRIPKP